MIRALYSAASGMTAQQMNVDNIANNLANANTNGFKMRQDAISGLALPELRPARRGGRFADHCSERAANRTRNTPGVQRNHFFAGEFPGNR